MSPMILLLLILLEKNQNNNKSNIKYTQIVYLYKYIKYNNNKK